VGFSRQQPTPGRAGAGLLNLPAWNHVPLRDIVAGASAGRWVLDNDTNLCAVGASLWGRAGAKNMVYVTLATGYGHWHHH